MWYQHFFFINKLSVFWGEQWQLIGLPARNNKLFSSSLSSLWRWAGEGQPCSSFKNTPHSSLPQNKIKNAGISWGLLGFLEYKVSACFPIAYTSKSWGFFSDLLREHTTAESEAVHALTHRSPYYTGPFYVCSHNNHFNFEFIAFASFNLHRLLG